MGKYQPCQHGRDFWDLAGFQRQDVGACGFEIDLNKERDIEQNGRNGCCQSHLGIRNAQKLGHDESGDAHHRRHQLPAGRSAGFDRSREMRAKADATHHRDGHDADGHDVGDDIAGNGAEQGRAHDRDLGRTAAMASHQRHGDVGEEGSTTRLEQHITE